MSILSENQNQHRVSQVYLKQFATAIDGDWLLSVYGPGSQTTEQVSVKEFTAANNIFDHPYGDIEFRRNFEIQCGRVETLYPVVLSNLDNQKQLTDKNVDVLVHFIASLLTRSKAFTEFIALILGDQKARQRFIAEITVFNPELKPLLKRTLPKIPADKQLNALLGTITQHLVEVLRNFDFTVIKNPDDIFWATSDNPVILDKKDNFEWLISVDSELYMPLSRNYCLFIFHPDASDRSNSLRNGKCQLINRIDDATFERVQQKIIRNLINYFIIPVNLPPTKLNAEMEI